jgi:hypothetical protein
LSVNVIASCRSFAGSRTRCTKPRSASRLTIVDGWRITCFATKPRGPGWTWISSGSATGNAPAPKTASAHSKTPEYAIALAADLLAWPQTLAWDEHEPARRWEPKRLRLRILAIAGRIIHSGR